jgi:Uma2 family endonuclease
MAVTSTPAPSRAAVLDPAEIDEQLVEATEDSEHPMSEREFHGVKLLLESIERVLAGRTAWVGCYLRLEHGPEGRSHLVPDCLVALGVPRGTQDVYRMSEVGKAPDLVIELASPSTARRELSVKPAIYEEIGVRELVIFDPGYDDPYKRALPFLVPLAGYLRDSEGRLRFRLAEQGRLQSQVLGVTFEVHGSELRLRGPDGALVPTDAEALAQAEEARQQAEEARQQAEEARQQAEEARQQAQARAAALEEELRRLRGERGDS